MSDEISAPAELLIGHTEAEAALIRMARSGRLPHAILLGGSRGIGKATLARRLAEWLLAGQDRATAPALFGDADSRLWVDPANPVVRRITAGGHADLLVVERAWDPTRKRLRTEIIAEDARGIAEFFHLTPAEGGWRIAIVDGAEEMNRHAANAVLKILEEPPSRCLLILVSHEPGGLLPTIRSRCQMVSLQPLADDQVVALLARLRPDAVATEFALASRLARGSIGNALSLIDADGIQLHRALIELLASLPRLDIPGVHALADQVTRRDSGGYDVLTELLLDLIARWTIALGGRVRDGIAEEGPVIERLKGTASLDRWAALWENLRVLFQRAAAVNLDRKQVLLDAFLAVEATAAS